MAIGRTKKTGNFTKAGRFTAEPADPATIQPFTIFKDETTGFYKFVGDAGLLMPLVGSVNHITLATADGVWAKKIASGTNTIVNVGGGANQARIRLKTVSSQGVAVQSSVDVRAGANASGVTAAVGTLILPPLVGNEAVVFSVITDATTGQLDITITFATSGAKNIIFTYGPDLFMFAGFTVN